MHRPSKGEHTRRRLVSQQNRQRLGRLGLERISKPGAAGWVGVAPVLAWGVSSKERKGKITCSPKTDLMLSIPAPPNTCHWFICRRVALEENAGGGRELAMLFDALNPSSVATDIYLF